jgi:tetratricopeptide (TPR) repeat protein
MHTITLLIVMNRWPATLADTLEVLAPYVQHKVAIVDRSAGLESLDIYKSSHFDRVRYMDRTSFDKLRNASLELARELDASAWALMLDSDEFIDTSSAIALQKLASNSDSVSAYLLPCYNYVGHGRWASTYRFRLIRLSDPIDFRNSIHESISASLVRNDLSWAYGNVPIQHLDFLSPVASKREQYKSSLQAAIGCGEDLTFLKTLYAIECIWAGEDELGLLQLDEAISMASEPCQSRRFSGRDDFPVAIKAQYFARLGRLGEAESLWTRLYAAAEQRVKAESALGLASISTRKGDYTRALQWTDASLSLWTTAEGYISRATTLYTLKQRDLAYDSIMKGLELNPMAADSRIQGPIEENSVFDLQSLLNPEFSGLPNLIRSLSTL